MNEFLMTWAVPALRTLNEIFTAAVSITAFSIFLFTFMFIRKEKLARVFLMFSFCITVIYSADALETMTNSISAQFFWQKLHWTGFILLPAIFYHFSDVLLSMTGEKFVIRKFIFRFLGYLFSLLFCLALWTNYLFIDIKQIENIGTTMVPQKSLQWFWLYFGALIILAFVNLTLAFSRTRTRVSRRRMRYLIVGSVCILAGTFPLLLFGTGSFSYHPLIFWSLSCIANALVAVMVLMVGYSVATFSVSWSDRITRQTLIEWILRGPFVASVTLGIVTVANRSTGILSLNINGMASLLTVISIVVLEYLIMLLLPKIQRNSVTGYGQKEYDLYTSLERVFIFKPEVQEYLEALVSALCDKFQSNGGFAAILDSKGNVDSFIKTGKPRWETLEEVPQHLLDEFKISDKYILDDEGILCPIFQDENGKRILLGIIGITGDVAEKADNGNIKALDGAVSKARAVLWHRWYVNTAFEVFHDNLQSDESTPLRKADLWNHQTILDEKNAAEIEQVSGWVRDALTHYWGGPRLTENPLIEFDIVKKEALGENDSPVNALRTVLKKAIERIRPAGERSFTTEWILYNILDLKFINRQKVKEVARKLSVSEADLYRKQKVAIEEIAKTILEMEKESVDEKREQTR